MGQSRVRSAQAPRGRESEILRMALPWSIGMLVMVCLIVGLQATVLEGWMP